MLEAGPPGASAGGVRALWSVCEQANAILASVTEPIDTSSEVGLALVRILVTFAALESATIGVRMRAKHRQLAEQGQPPSTSVKPFGLSATTCTTARCAR